jgi:hypothetical protein
MPYGPTRIFLTVEPEELLCVRDTETSTWITNCPAEKRVHLPESLHRVAVRIDFRLALDQLTLSNAMKMLKGELPENCAMNVQVMSPKSAQKYFQQPALREPSPPQDQSASDALVVVLSKTTCHPFIDLLSGLGQIAYPTGGHGLLESIDHYLLGEEERAVTLLLDPLKGVESNIVLALIDGSKKDASTLAHYYAGQIGEMYSYHRGSSRNDMPDDATALIGGLGGEPTDSVPSVGIPYMLSALSSSRFEVAGFVGMWNQPLVDLPLFASASLPQHELVSRIERRFDWHDIVLYMIRQVKSDERTRLVTSMPPALVSKILKWRVLNTGSDLLRSLRRSVEGDFRLAMARDLSMSFAPRKSEHGETKEED